MPWFNVDDGAHCHPKIIAAGNAAFGLFVRLGSYSSAYATEGRVPMTIVHAYGSKSERERLITAGLLHRDGDEYVMHDFLDYNRDAVQIARDRAKAAERKRRQRERDRSHEERDSHGVTGGVTDGVTAQRGGGGFRRVGDEIGASNGKKTADLPAGNKAVDKYKTPGSRDGGLECHGVSHGPQAKPSQAKLVSNSPTAAAVEMGGLPAAAAAAIGMLIEHKVANESKRNPGGLRKQLSRDLPGEWHDALHGYLAQHPSASAADLAQHVLGLSELDLFRLAKETA